MANGWDRNLCKSTSITTHGSFGRHVEANNIPIEADVIFNKNKTQTALTSNSKPTMYDSDVYSTSIFASSLPLINDWLKTPMSSNFLRLQKKWTSHCC